MIYPFFVFGRIARQVGNPLVPVLPYLFHCTQSVRLILMHQLMYCPRDAGVITAQTARAVSKYKHTSQDGGGIPT